MATPSTLNAQITAKDPGDASSHFEREPVSFRETWRVIPLPRERSLVVTLLCHWASLSTTADLPSIGKLDPRALPIDWRNCVLLRRGPGADWSFEYRGDAFLDPGPAAPSTNADTHDPTPRNRLAEWIGLALEAANPITVGGAVQQDDGQRIRFRSLLLPFGDGSGTITHMLAASTARDLLSLEPRHLPVEAHAYIGGFWVHQTGLP